MIDGGVEKSYSAFEKILYIFVIPVVFTVILALALFALFGYNVKDTLLEYGNKIPYIGQYIPKPLAENETIIKENGKDTVVEKKVDDFGQDVTKEFRILKDQLTLTQNDLEDQKSLVTQRDAKIKKLETDLKATKEKLQKKSLSDKEYLAKINELAEVYGTMSPGKAAPIIENLSTEEAVLVLNQMSTEEKKDVLAKMTPARAAEISILTKDVTPLKNQELEALRSRLKIQNPNGSAQSSVSKPEMSDTYAGMDPKAAALILVELQKDNPERVYTIMVNMDTAARSSILAEMPVNIASTITDRIAK